MRVDVKILVNMGFSEQNLIFWKGPSRVKIFRKGSVISAFKRGQGKQICLRLSIMCNVILFVGFWLAYISWERVISNWLLLDVLENCTMLFFWVDVRVDRADLHVDLLRLEFVKPKKIPAKAQPYTIIMMGETHVLHTEAPSPFPHHLRFTSYCVVATDLEYENTCLQSLRFLFLPAVKENYQSVKHKVWIVSTNEWEKTDAKERGYHSYSLAIGSEGPSTCWSSNWEGQPITRKLVYKGCDLKDKGAGLLQTADKRVLCRKPQYKAKIIMNLQSYSSADQS